MSFGEYYYSSACTASTNSSITSASSLRPCAGGGGGGDADDPSHQYQQNLLWKAQARNTGGGTGGVNGGSNNNNQQNHLQALTQQQQQPSSVSESAIRHHHNANNMPSMSSTTLTSHETSFSPCLTSTTTPTRKNTYTYSTNEYANIGLAGHLARSTTSLSAARSTTTTTASVTSSSLNSMRSRPIVLHGRVQSHGTYSSTATATAHSTTSAAGTSTIHDATTCYKGDREDVAESSLWTTRETMNTGITGNSMMTMMMNTLDPSRRFQAVQPQQQEPAQQQQQPYQYRQQQQQHYQQQQQQQQRNHHHEQHHRHRAFISNTSPTTKMATTSLNTSTVSTKSAYSNLHQETLQFQKLVTELEAILNVSAETPSLAWRARIIMRSAQDADDELWRKLQHYDKDLQQQAAATSDSHNNGSSSNRTKNRDNDKNESRIRQAQSACMKLHRDFKRSHRALVMALSLHRKRQCAEVSRLGAVQWNAQDHHVSENHALLGVHSLSRIPQEQAVRLSHTRSADRPSPHALVPLGRQEHHHRSAASAVEAEKEDFFDRAMREREAEIERIHKSMHQVKDIYKDLAYLIDVQQETIEQLEEEVQESKDTVDDAAWHILSCTTSAREHVVSCSPLPPPSGYSPRSMPTTRFQCMGKELTGGEPVVFEVPRFSCGGLVGLTSSYTEEDESTTASDTLSSRKSLVASEDSSDCSPPPAEPVTHRRMVSSSSQKRRGREKKQQQQHQRHHHRGRHEHADDDDDDYYQEEDEEDDIVLKCQHARTNARHRNLLDTTTSTTNTTSTNTSPKHRSSKTSRKSKRRSSSAKGFEWLSAPFQVLKMDLEAVQRDIVGFGKELSKGKK